MQTRGNVYGFGNGNVVYDLFFNALADARDEGRFAIESVVHVQNEMNGLGGT